jgi:hypothetical protein
MIIEIEEKSHLKCDSFEIRVGTLKIRSFGKEAHILVRVQFRDEDVSSICR